MILFIRRSFLPLLSAGLIVLFAGCAPKDRPADIAARQGILLWGNGAEPQGLDPHIVTGVPENHIISTLLEGLITYHLTDDNEPEPGVAASWTHNEDASEWIFNLRPEARWSNGDPVTAQDFVYSWNRMLSPAFAAKYADMLYILENGEDFHKGRLENFAQVGVKALDDHTLQVRLKGPTPYFLSMLKHYSWFPVHPGTIEKYGGMNELASAWTRREFVGNGPFTLAEWSPNQIIRVTRSPTYWDRAKVKLEAIHFRPIENQNTEESAFRNGELHVTNVIPPAMISVYREKQPHLLKIEPYLGTYFYRLNVERPPLDNPKVRQALALCINRDLIVENVTRGGQIPATAYTPPGMKGYGQLDLVPYDPERARQLLAEAGFPGGQGFPPLEILFNTLEAHRAIAESIQNMWKTELGIDVKILNQEWKVYIVSQQTLQYDISRSGWIGDYMDPITFLSIWTSGNGNNNTGWSHPDYDRLIDLAQREGDPDKRLQILYAAEKLLLGEMPIAPIYWYTRTYLLDPRVKNWNPKLLDNRPAKYLDIDRGA